MEAQTLVTPSIFKTVNPHDQEGQLKTLLEWAYSTHSFKERKVRLPQVSAHTGLKVWKLYKLALKYGFTKPNQCLNRWQPKEKDLLERYAHLQADKIVQKLAASGFKRTIASVESMRKELQLGIRQARLDAGVYSAEELAKMMGVSPSMVKLWINNGYLKAKKGSTQYEINNYAIKEFITNHPLRFNLSGVNQMWFIDLLNNTK